MKLSFLFKQPSLYLMRFKAVLSITHFNERRYIPWLWRNMHSIATGSQCWRYWNHSSTESYQRPRNWCWSGHPARTWPCATVTGTGWQGVSILGLAVSSTTFVSMWQHYTSLSIAEIHLKCCCDVMQLQNKETSLQRESSSLDNSLLCRQLKDFCSCSTS